MTANDYTSAAPWGKYIDSEWYPYPINYRAEPVCDELSRRFRAAIVTANIPIIHAERMAVPMPINEGYSYECDGFEGERYARETWTPAPGRLTAAILLASAFVSGTIIYGGIYALARFMGGH